MADYNAVNFKYFLNTECYVSVIISTVSFTVLFLLIYYILGHRILFKLFHHLKKDEALYWKIIDAVISMIHGLLILILIVIFEKDRLSLILSQEMMDSYTTNQERIIPSISIGYFIYDTIVGCIIFSKKHKGKVDYLYITHHIISIIGMSVIIIVVHAGCLVIIAVFWFEISSPLLHFNTIRNRLIDRSRPILKSTHLTDFIIKVFYILLYIMARFMIGGYIAYQAIFTVNNTPIILIVNALLVWTMSIILLYPLQRDLRKTYIKYKKSEYLAVNEQSSTTANELTENDQDESSSESDEENTRFTIEYNEILKLSQKSVIQFFITGAVYIFFHITRMSIYLLYAKQFDPTPIQIGLLLYGFNFWNGIAAILYGSLANTYGYDTMLVALLIMQCIAVALESIAGNFYILFTGIIIGQVAIPYIVMGYIAWILPEKQAKQYTAYFYAACIVGYLIGPISAGIISFFVTYRMVFVINLFLCFCALCHSVVFIAKKQKKLEMRQLRIEIVSAKDDDEQFPICLEKYKNGKETVDHIKWYQLPKMSYYEAIMLVFILVINSTVNVAESCITLYYTTWIIEEVGGNVLTGTGGLLLISFSFLFGSLIAPKWFDNQYKYWTIIVCLTLCMFHVYYLFPMVKKYNLYWLWCITSGFPHGLYSMVSEMIQLEIQPTKYSGKINGAKGLIRNWLIALGLLIISLYWDIDHNSFYYVVGVVFGVALLLTVLMILMKNKFGQ